MDRREPRRIEVDGVTLMWGVPAECKAVLRDESVRRHLERPLPERLLAALSMVRRASDDRRP